MQMQTFMHYYTLLHTYKANGQKIQEKLNHGNEF